MRKFLLSSRSVRYLTLIKEMKGLSVFRHFLFSIIENLDIPVCIIYACIFCIYWGDWYLTMKLTFVFQSSMQLQYFKEFCNLELKRHQSEDCCIRNDIITYEVAAVGRHVATGTPSDGTAYEGSLFLFKKND